MRYTKRGTYKNLSQYVRAKTGKSLADLNKYADHYTIANLEKAAERILRAVRNQEGIYIHCDYDADGTTSAAQIVLLLRKLGARNYNVCVPRRFSDGYGVQVQHVPAGNCGLMITIDNGITAIEAIKEAKMRGMDVIILDHHLSMTNDSGLILPDADIIVDPEAIPDGNDFTNYCASGIVNRMNQIIIPNDDEFMLKCASLSAIGTVADVVPLLEDNRKIVQTGIWAMNHGKGTAGVQALIDATGLTGNVTSESIAFKLGPMVNAPGRLYDTGGMSAAMTLVSDDKLQALEYGAKMKLINDQRKEMIGSAMEKAIPEDTPVQVLKVDANPGLLGIIAGKIAETTGKPAFVYAVSNGKFHGSSRSDDETRNNVKDMLDSVEQFLLTHGGHPGAAGFSGKEEDEMKFKNALMKYPVKEHIDQNFFDLCLCPEKAKDELILLDQAEPFGKGLERPVYRIECHFTEPGFYGSMGKDGSHLKFNLPGDLKGVAFSMMDKFVQAGKPKDLMLYGSLTWNVFRGKRSPNFMISDFEAI